MKKNWPARLLTVCYGNHVMESSLAPFLFAHFGSPVILKETNYRNEITGQFSLTPDLCYPEQPVLYRATKMDRHNTVVMGVVVL